MEIITLVTLAFNLAKPFLTKTGEKFSENIGEDIWKFIKKPFIKESEEKLIAELKSEDKQNEFKNELIEKINHDPNFETELRALVEDAQQKIANNYQQNINNNGSIEKQINIQHNSGNIQM